MSSGDLHKVWEIKALKRKPGVKEAKKFLEKIANQVKPIMRKHKWRVKVLSEFCPNNPALLGLNVGRGIHVKLRLRRPNRDWEFYPFDHVLDIMLHELCHNAHGPHNATFYKLWDELRKECEELMSKGITGSGEGFDLLGKRLGGFSRQPPHSSLRQTALTAAENRACLGSLLPSGPKCLGGDSTIKDALTPIHAASMAAERRLQDDLWCGSHCSEIAGNEESCADTLQDHLDSDQGAEKSSVKDGSSGHAFGRTSLKRGRMQDKPESNFVDLTTPVSGSAFNQDNRGVTAMWECKSCFLLNPSFTPICELCFIERPRDIGTKYKFWSCKFCTLENPVKLDKCSACDQWRYSHGPPISIPAPNRGT